MNERVKTVAMVLFLIIVGLVLYQMYFSEFSASPESSSTPTPTEIAQPEPSTTPVVQVIQNTNVNSGIKVVIPQNTNNNSSLPVDLGDPMTQFLSQSGFSQVRVEDVRQEKEIFAIRIDSIPGVISKRYAYENATMVGVLYALPGDISYEQVKSAILDKISASPVWSMNETNNYGRASFYLNNKNRADTVFILIKFNEKTYGFEYQKNDQARFERVFSFLGK